jgi:hypothetical protein
MPGAIDAGGDVLSDTSIDHGSNDRVEKDIRGSEKRLGVENVERDHGERVPEGGCVPSINSMVSCSDAARGASLIHDTRGVSIDRPLDNIVCLMENAADAL